MGVRKTVLFDVGGGWKKQKNLFEVVENFMNNSWKSNTWKTPKSLYSAAAFKNTI